MSNYAKLKTNLKLAIQRLKLLEKKKTELSHKSRREIADYLTINKVDRARIRVEHIIREDNFVEGMEMLEMFCDLLIARFGLIEKMKELDPGLDESISTILWAAPRIMNDIQEFKAISEILTQKYGKNYAEACRTDSLKNVNEKVKKRLGIEPPSKLLVEQYLIEIAKNFNVKYEPDSAVFLRSSEVDDLINFGGGASGGGGGGSASGGGIGFGGSGHHPSDGIGFDNIVKSSNNSPPKKSSSSQANSFDNEPDDFLMPVLPPPLPKSFPNEKTDRLNDSSPPPIYSHEKNGFSQNSDLNSPLPFSKQNMQQFTTNLTDFSPPPIYQEKQPSSAYNNTPVKPTAPARTTSNDTKHFMDFPTVPNDDENNDDDFLKTEKKSNVQDEKKDEEDDVNFDDLQKRFQNLKKL